jgi:hypothetical protein
MLSKVDSANMYSRTLEKEISDLRAEQTRLSDLLNSGKNDQLKSEHRKNHAEIEILDLQK